MKLITLTGLLAAALVMPGMGVAQGRGPGFGRGAGMGRGMCGGIQAGRGAGMGAGGWWTRVSPQTAEQKALVQKVTELHAKVRAANLEIANLTARKAAPEKIAAKQRDATALRAELQRVTQTDAPLIRQMGIPAGYGVCDGTGPKGPNAGCAMCPYVGADCANCPYYGVSCAGCGVRGPGGRRGTGAGGGLRLRDGTGPNCPLAK